MKNGKINTNINMFKIKTVREAKSIKHLALKELEGDNMAIKSAKADVRVARAEVRKAKAELRKQKRERNELRKFIKRLDARIKALPEEMARARDINAVVAEAKQAGVF